MRRLIGLGILILVLFLLGAYRAISAPNSASPVYLPSVANPPPTATATPTPEPAPLTWALRSSIPGYPCSCDNIPIGAAAAGGLLYSFVYSEGPNLSAENLYAVSYDPSTDTWSYRAGTAINFGCCAFGAAATATNGKIYLLGSSLATGVVTLEYDPIANSWRTRASIPLGPSGVQWGLSWVAATNGKLYALGGIDSSFSGQSWNQIYDPATNAWSDGAPLPFTSLAPDATATSNGKIYVFGDRVDAEYDPASNSWSNLASPALPATYTGAAQAGDGKIYLAGGPWTPGVDPGSSNWVVTYDPGSDVWGYQTDLLYGGQSPIVVATGDDLYVLSGQVNGARTAWVEEAKVPAP